MLELFSRDGALWDEKGNRVQLRGVNYFGVCARGRLPFRSRKAPPMPRLRDADAPSSSLTCPRKTPKKQQASKPPTLPRTACGPRNLC